MKSRLAPALGLVGLLATVALVAVKRRGGPKPSAELLPYQTWVSALSAVERERFIQVRAALRQAELQRGKDGQWPAAFAAPGLGWVQRRHGHYVNYLGVPADGARLRWLVLFIEPEPSAIKDPAPPEDDEHHTLGDGTALHVSVWTSPNEGPVPQAVLPFPAAEEWTQRLSEL